MINFNTNWSFMVQKDRTFDDLHYGSIKTIHYDMFICLLCDNISKN